MRLGGHHLGDRQEAVALQPDVDEGRVHARQHVLHPALVDVAHQRLPVRTLQVHLRRPAVLEHGDPRLQMIARDDELFHGILDSQSTHDAGPDGLERA